MKRSSDSTNDSARNSPQGYSRLAGELDQRTEEASADLGLSRMLSRTEMSALIAASNRRARETALQQ